MVNRPQSKNENSAIERFAAVALVSLFTVKDDTLCVAVVPNRFGASDWSLPGNFVKAGYSVEQTVDQILKVELKLRRRDDWYLEQIGSYETFDSLLQERSLTIGYFSVIPRDYQVQASRYFEWVPVYPKHNQEKSSLSAEHAQIVGDSLERIRSLLEYTTFASRFLGPIFMVSELRQIYEIVWRTPIDPGNFRRNIDKCGGFVKEDTDDSTQIGQVEFSRRRRGRPPSYWLVQSFPERNQPGRMLTRALASRERGQSLLGIRTRSPVERQTQDELA